MLKDITLGQFFPGNTIAHRLDPRTKLILVVVYIVALFQTSGWISYIAVTAATAGCMAASKIKPGSIFKGLKPMLFIIALTALLNIFYTEGTPVLPGWIVTWEGIARAFQMVLRIVLLITGTFLLTYTTSPIALTDGMELLFAPLKKIKVPVHEMTMMMSMALRFIPTLIEETDKIMSAQKARGADFETGSLMSRAKALDMFISFDPNLRPQLWKDEKEMVRTLNSLAQEADLVLPGLSEGKILTKRDTPEGIAEFYHERGVDSVIVKLGEKGAYWSTGGEHGTVPAFPVKRIVDTVGAGDGFAAGVLSAVAEGMSLQEAAARGTVIGSIQITHRGDNEGLPTRAELETITKAGIV